MEYALVLALVAAVAIASLTLVGAGLGNTLTTLTDAVDAVAEGRPWCNPHAQQICHGQNAGGNGNGNGNGGGGGGGGGP